MSKSKATRDPDDTVNSLSELQRDLLRVGYTVSVSDLAGMYAGTRTVIRNWIDELEDDPDAAPPSILVDMKTSQRVDKPAAKGNGKAKRSRPASTLDVPGDGPVDLPVKFGSISIGDTTASIGIKIARTAIPSIKRADELLTNRRLHAVISVGDDAPQLPTMEDDDQPCLEAIFDSRSLSSRAKSYGAKLALPLETIDLGTFARFASRDGRVRIDRVEVIESKERSHPDVDEGQDRPHGTPALAAVADMVDPPLSRVEATIDGKPRKFTPAQIEKFEAAKVTRLRQLEGLMNAPRWWERFPGVGKTAVDKIADLVQAYRAKHPIPSTEG